MEARGCRDGRLLFGGRSKADVSRLIRIDLPLSLSLSLSLSLPLSLSHTFFLHLLDARLLEARRRLSRGNARGASERTGASYGMHRGMQRAGEEGVRRAGIVVNVFIRKI